ncbi:MAG TPA: contact-dependent growth inhibition system immunity protein [Acidimicrobiales bacterium]|nr:contact-dependent growth inhibition system immunity protein [Acidimicrobiales bacterium]
MSAFFRSCFNPARLAGGICVADLVRSWARHHSPGEVERAADQVAALLRSGVGEDALRVWVLGTLGCGFDPGLHGMAMAAWLGLVRDLLLGRGDAALPGEAWLAMQPWPAPDVDDLGALRHLVGGYFGGDRPAAARTFEAVVERFVEDEGPARTAELVDDIDALLALGLGEERLRIVVLGRLGCAYDPRPDLPGGKTMAQWLRAVRGIAVSSAVSRLPG